MTCEPQCSLPGKSCCFLFFPPICQGKRDSLILQPSIMPGDGVSLQWLGAKLYYTNLFLICPVQPCHQDDFFPSKRVTEQKAAPVWCGHCPQILDIAKKEKIITWKFLCFSLYVKGLRIRNDRRAFLNTQLISTLMASSLMISWYDLINESSCYVSNGLSSIQSVTDARHSLKELTTLCHGKERKT